VPHARRNLIDLLQELGRDPSAFRNQIKNEAEEITDILSSFQVSDVKLVLLLMTSPTPEALLLSGAFPSGVLLPFYEPILKTLVSKGLFQAGIPMARLAPFFLIL